MDGTWNSEECLHQISHSYSQEGAVGTDEPRQGSRGLIKAEHCSVSVRPKKGKPLGSTVEKLLFIPGELAKGKLRRPERQRHPLQT